MEVFKDKQGFYSCEMCNNEKQDCPAMSDSGFLCTREEGHTGEHVACGICENEHPFEKR